MKFKNRIKIGLWVLIPIFLFIFLANIVINLFRIWNPLLSFLGLPKDLYTIISIVLTVVSVYFISFAITSRRVNWIFSRVPVIRRVWNALKTITDRIVFASQGGYKIVMYNGFHNETVRERPGIVLGKVKREYANGKVKTLLVVMQPPPNVFDSYLMPPEDTEVLVGNTRDLMFYMFSGGIINPPSITTRKWAKGEYEEIPGSPPNGNGNKPKEENEDEESSD